MPRLRKKQHDQRGRSKFEEQIMEDLEARGIKYEYESIKLKYVKKTCKHCGEVTDTGIYTPDFIIGSLIVEGKGVLDVGTRTKMVNVKKSNPTCRLAFLFQRDNKLSRSSKTRYTEWAVKHGFLAAVGTSVPQEWLTDET